MTIILLVDGMVSELGQDTEGNDGQAERNNNQRQQYGLPVARSKLRRLRAIGKGGDRIQVLKVVQHVLHMLIALLRITTNSAHYDRRQGRRKMRDAFQDRGRVLRNMLVDDGQDVFTFERSMLT